MFLGFITLYLLTYNVFCTLPPSSLKLSNVLFILYNCMQCSFLKWRCYLNWAKDTCAFHVTYLSEGKKVISFKNPLNPYRTPPSSFLRFLSPHFSWQPNTYAEKILTQLFFFLSSFSFTTFSWQPNMLAQTHLQKKNP